jgi:SAM-dependent methyltransferase
MRRVSTPSSSVAIIGSGASSLVGALVDQSYAHLICIDLAQAALDALREQLGSMQSAITTLCTDVLTMRLGQLVDVWHDRATFHFFTDPTDQARYVNVAAQSIRPGGSMVLATFAPDGPAQCSGLDVQRWSPDDLAERFAGHFTMVESFGHRHVTPWKSEQRFTYVVFVRNDT